MRWFRTCVSVDPNSMSLSSSELHRLSFVVSLLYNQSCVRNVVLCAHETRSKCVRIAHEHEPERAQELRSLSFLLFKVLMLKSCSESEDSLGVRIR